MQKLINDEWVDCAESELIIGDTYRINVGGGWQQQKYSKPAKEDKRLLISPTDIALAFPPESVAELNDYAWDITKVLANRGTAQQILYALKGNRDIDVLSDKFNNMLAFLLAEIPSYDAAADANFKNEVGI